MTAQKFSKSWACIPPNKRQCIPTFVTFPLLNFSFCNPSTWAKLQTTENAQAGAAPPGRRQRYLFRGAEGLLSRGSLPCRAVEDAAGMEHAEDYAFLSLRPDLSAAPTNCASDALSNYLLAPTPRPLLLRLALQSRAGLHWSQPTSLIALASTII